MASFRATLEFAGKEYDVLHSEYEFSRTTDAKGKPSSNIQGGRVENIKSLDPLLYSKLTHQKNIRIK